MLNNEVPYDEAIILPAHMIWKRFSFSNFLNTAIKVRMSAGFRPLVWILTAFDLYKLITYQERQERIVVRINGNVERNKHVKENERVRHCTSSVSEPIETSNEAYRHSPMIKQRRTPAWPADAYGLFRVSLHSVREFLLQTKCLKHLVQRRNKAYRRSVLVLVEDLLSYRYLAYFQGIKDDIELDSILAPHGMIHLTSVRTS